MNNVYVLGIYIILRILEIDSADDSNNSTTEFSLRSFVTPEPDRKSYKIQYEQNDIKTPYIDISNLRMHENVGK